MEATLLKRAFGVDREWEYRSTKYVGGGIEVHVQARKEEIECPKCGSNQVVLRGSRERRMRSVPIGPKPVTIVAAVPHCQCGDCGKDFDFAPLLPREDEATPTNWRNGCADCVG